MFVARLIAVSCALLFARATLAQDVPTVQFRVESLASAPRGVSADLAIRLDLPRDAQLVGCAFDIAVDGHDGGAPSTWTVMPFDDGVSARILVSAPVFEAHARREQARVECVVSPSEGGAWERAPRGPSLRLARGTVSTWTRHPDVPIVVRVERALVNVRVDGRVHAADVEGCIGWSPGVAPRVAARALRSAAAATPMRLQPRIGDVLPEVSAEQRARFAAGRARFEQTDDAACAACHRIPTTGGSSERPVRRVERSGRAGNTFDSLEFCGAPLLNVSAQGSGVEESTPGAATHVIDRLAPALFGLGLVEAIEDDAIEAAAARQPLETRGRVRYVTPAEGGGFRVGRFGRKCQVGSIHSAVAGARLVEAKPVKPDVVTDPEVVVDVARLVDFQRFLAPPPQHPAAGHLGERVFERVGCAACHIARWTASDDAQPPLAGVTLRPYSDFLLHDMGALGDGNAHSAATGRDVRTAPLWGLATRRAYLHDGRIPNLGFVTSVAAAIAEHDGQGRASAARYAALEAGERELLLAFLATLGRPHGDVDGDLDVDFDDWRAAMAAIGRVPSRPSPADLDDDGDVDTLDLLALQRALRE